MQKPKNWPESFIYSPESICNQIHPNLLYHFFSTEIIEDEERVTPCIEEKRVHPDIELRQLKDSHPLSKLPEEHSGVFAVRSIPEREILGEYVGEIFFGLKPPKEHWNDRGTYSWSFQIKGNDLCVHGGEIANEIVFVNDFRGIQEKPNVLPAWAIHRGRYYLVYRTERAILPGEEILVDYGPAWSKAYRE